MNIRIRRRGPVMNALWLAFTLAFCSSPAAAIDDPISLAAEAASANPGIEALRAQTQALSELVGAAGTWSDPVVGLEYMNAPVDSFRLDRAPMSGLQFMIEQNLPEWGRSDASIAVADSRVDASREAVREAQLQLRRSVEVLYWQLTLVDLLEVVTNSHLEHTKQLVSSLQVRYEVGKIGQTAILRLGILRDRLQDELGDFEWARRRSTAGLNAALSRSSSSRFDCPKEVSPLAVAGSAVEWLAAARDQRPELQRIREETDTERKEAVLARIEARPDLKVWAKYRVRTIDTVSDSGRDFVSLGLSVPIPWGSRKRDLAREASHLAKARGSQARLAAKVEGIEAELAAIEARWIRAFEKAAVYRDRLIPAAQTTLDTALSDLSVGKADFSSLHESQIDLLILEKAYLSAAIETHIQSARMRGVTGVAPVGGPHE